MKIIDVKPIAKLTLLKNIKKNYENRCKIYSMGAIMHLKETKYRKVLGIYGGAPFWTLGILFIKQ